MKAIQQNTFGDADVLYSSDIARPNVMDNECLIKVEYTSVNYADIKKRKGNKEKASSPFILGLDAAGTIAETNKNSPFEIGDRVIAFPKAGSYAEYVTANEALIYKIPDSLSFEQAAAMPTITILAYILLKEIGQVEKDDVIVVHSAAGGVGSMIIQLAKYLGIKKIIGTVGNLNKEDYVKQLGADLVSTYDTFVENVLEATDEKGVAVIFDSVAGDVTRKSLDCLAYYGTLVQFGNSSGKAGVLSTNDVHKSCRNIKGFSLGTTRKHDPSRLRPVADQVISLCASKAIQVPIAKVFPLSEAREAHLLMESRNYQGKILLKVNEA